MTAQPKPNMIATVIDIKDGMIHFKAKGALATIYLTEEKWLRRNPLPDIGARYNLVERFDGMVTHLVAERLTDPVTAMKS